MLEETIVNDQAIKFLNRVSNLSLEQLANIMKNAQTLDELGQYEEAVSWYNLAIKNYPRDIVAWYNKGNVLDNIGKFEEATSLFEEIISIDPTHIGALTNRRVSLDKLGMHYGTTLIKKKQML